MKIESAIRQRDTINRRIAEYKREIKALPKGKLYCGKSKRYYKWYVKINNEKTYIPKSKKEYALKLAKKRLLEAKIEDLEFDKRLLNTIITKEKKHVPAVYKLYDLNSPYHEIISEYNLQISQYNKEWIKERNAKPQSHAENLTNKTIENYYVRSKAERDIANALFMNNIDYQYECPIEIAGVIYHPDFKIIHPKTGKIYYWEHCGIMDDDRYRDTLYNKLKVYGTVGIMPPVNLILTYEIKTIPLGTEEIQQIIDKFFFDDDVL